MDGWMGVREELRDTRREEEMNFLCLSKRETILVALLSFQLL